MRGSSHEMNVTVRRVEVLAALRLNRADHEETYNEAVIGYRKRTEQVVANALDAIRSGRQYNVFINLSEPSNQLKTFDRVIRMMEMSVDEAIDLTEAQFLSYVMNEWDWMRSFASSNAMYSAKALAMTQAF
jgi:hypothetical protein